ncbi:hypothetical protein BDW22DRAFT_1353570 [Trametopsis cervina]|nr:hypothetical protein BDW22DRAFT_1353570 [Trametopsis cervina]
MPESSEQTIKLVFNPSLKVAGEVISGEVQLHFPGLMRDKVVEVHVKLRGSVFTRITRQIGQNTYVRHDRVYLAHEEVSLWKQGDGVYPPPDSDTLKLPFTFTLPENLLPSCQYGGGGRMGTVGYFIQVVGKRPGVLRINDRQGSPFPVIQSLSAGAQMREALRQGWQGRWKTITDEKEIRRGLWGDYSRVKFTLVLPDVINVLPVLTPIPFTLTIVTHSKPTTKEDKPPEETIFPAPPLKPHEIDFRIERNVYIRTGSWDSYSEGGFIAYLGGMGPKSSSASQSAVQVEPMEKVWIPLNGDEKKQKGCWKQEVTFKSTFQLSCPPAFDANTMKVFYIMRLKVDFPGIGNSVKTDFPVRVVSCMYPPGQRGWDGPPPEMDLPPDYFQATTWDNDEKD